MSDSSSLSSLSSSELSSSEADADVEGLDGVVTGRCAECELRSGVDGADCCGLACWWVGDGSAGAGECWSSLSEAEGEVVNVMASLCTATS